jgi:hypothetical protein
MILEDVPAFIRRVGDQVIEGSNNVTMVFGTDRLDELDSGLGHMNAGGKGVDTGTWHVMTGRSSQNPNFESDKSFIYVSSKTEVDKNLGLSGIEFDTNEVPAIALKSDAIRIIARKDIKIIAGDSIVTMKSSGEITIQGTSIKLGNAKSIIPDLNNVVLGGAIDSFTGVPYHTLHKASGLSDRVQASNK